MTKRERDDLCQAIKSAIEDDGQIYDMLPGDGQDDFILDLIYKHIEQVRVATKTEEK